MTFPSFSPHFMSNFTPKDLPGYSSLQKTNEQYRKLQELLGADNLANLLKKADKQQRERDDYKAQRDALISASGADNFGNSLKRIESWRKKFQIAPLADAFNFDISWLSKPSPAWAITITVDTEDWDKEKDKWQKRRENWRKQCVNMYNSFMEEVYEICIEEGVQEDDFPRYMLQGHEVIQEDYLHLSYYEFWKKYDEEIDVSLFVIEQAKTVPFIDCLRFVEETCPRGVFRELEKSRNVLGDISKVQYDRWEAIYTTANAKPAKEGNPEMRRLMFSIIGGMIYRYTHEKGWPTPIQENSLQLLLSTPEENPAGADWEVTDNTSLLQFITMFNQLTEA